MTVFGLSAAKDALLTPGCKKSPAVQILEEVSAGLRWTSGWSPIWRGAGGHVIFQVGHANSDAAAAIAEPKSPQAAGTDGVANGTLADP
jgi:hypothetical protein